MTTYDNALSYVKDQMQQGKMSLEDANIELIRMIGIRVVEGSIPAQVRKYLSSGVRAGRIGRLPKKGLAPEIYFHPNSRATAIQEQKKQVLEAVEAIKKICI